MHSRRYPVGGDASGGVGSSRSGQIEPGGDLDYFRVQVSESGELAVHTTGSLDTKGQLEDSAGAVLARDDDGGDGYNFRLAHAGSDRHVLHQGRRLCRKCRRRGKLERTGGVLCSRPNS